MSEVFKGSTYLVTRNRRVETPTTEMDEIIDGKPTGRIVTSYEFINGEMVYHYKGDAKVDERKVFYVDVGSLSTEDAVAAVGRLTQELAGRANKPAIPENAETVYVVEFDWQYGHEKVECNTVGEAKGYYELMMREFPIAKISNVEIYKERRIRERIPYETPDEKSSKKKAAATVDPSATVTDLDLLKAGPAGDRLQKVIAIQRGANK
jgi:hypothetical protein